MIGNSCANQCCGSLFSLRLKLLTKHGGGGGRMVFGCMGFISIYPYY